jgi:hypothetical protein
VATEDPVAYFYAYISNIVVLGAYTAGLERTVVVAVIFFFGVS